MLILVMPFHHLHVLRQLRGAAQPRTPRWHPWWHVPMEPCHGASCSSGRALLPAQVAWITAAPWSLTGCVAATCRWKKKNHWNHVRNYSLELLCLSQVICKGKEKAKPSSWKGENAGKLSFVIVEVSSSCDKRGKKAGKSPVCGFGDVRKVTLGMDVH